MEDIDLSLEDFVARVNSDLVGKLVNIASRCAGFVAARRRQARGPTTGPAALRGIRGAARHDRGALRHARLFRGDARHHGSRRRANQYVDSNKPWALAKDPAKAAEVLAVCTQGINLFRVLMSYLAPVMPQMAEKAGKFLRISFAEWNFVDTPLLDHPIDAYEPLATRLDPKIVAHWSTTRPQPRRPTPSPQRRRSNP